MKYFRRTQFIHISAISCLTLLLLLISLAIIFVATLLKPGIISVIFSASSLEINLPNTLNERRWTSGVVDEYFSDWSVELYYGLFFSFRRVKVHLMKSELLRQAKRLSAFYASNKASKISINFSNRKSFDRSTFVTKIVIIVS